MAYEDRKLRRQRVKYDNSNASNPLVYQLVLDGAKVTPTSAAITIYEPGNTTALVSAAAMTVSGTTKLIYSVDTTTEADWPIQEGYRAEIAITASAVVYPRHLMFDVVRFLFDLNIGFDQLVALDDGIKGMGWDGDDDMSAVINSCSDVLQAKLEARILKGERLIQEQLIDSTKFAQAARFYILGHIYRTKDNPTRAGEYMGEFKELWDAVLSTQQYDKAQDGEEDAELGGIQDVRLVL